MASTELRWLPSVHVFDGLPSFHAASPVAASTPSVVRSFAPSMLAGRRVHGQALGASLPALPELRRFDGLLAVTERPCRTLL